MCVCVCVWYTYIYIYTQTVMADSFKFDFRQDNNGFMCFGSNVYNIYICIKRIRRYVIYVYVRLYVRVSDYDRLVRNSV